MQIGGRAGGINNMKSRNVLSMVNIEKHSRCKPLNDLPEYHLCVCVLMQKFPVQTYKARGGLQQFNTGVSSTLCSTEYVTKQNKNWFL